MVQQHVVVAGGETSAAFAVSVALSQGTCAQCAWDSAEPDGSARTISHPRKSSGAGRRYTSDSWMFSSEISKSGWSG